MECSKNGRDLTIAANKYSEDIKGDKLLIKVNNPSTNWQEWIKTLGGVPFFMK